MDFETSNDGNDYGSAFNPKNQIIFTTWQAGAAGPVRHSQESEFGLAALRKDLARAKVLVAHNAKFELQWLARMGEDTTRWLVYDTMIGEYVLHGNIKVPLDLGSVSERYGFPGKEPVIAAMMEAGVNPADMPEGWLAARNVRDVETTRDIFLVQRNKLHEAGQLPIQFTRNLLTPVLADMEGTMLALDGDRVQAQLNRATLEFNDLNAKFQSIAPGMNFGSPQQMAKLLYDGLGFEELKRYGKPIRNAPSKAFPDGQPKTDSKTLDRLKASTQAQRDFLALRQKLGTVNAELTKNLEFFSRVVKERGGQFRGRWNQTVTRNHRLSSTGVKIVFEDGTEKGVQFQNFPRRFKPLFRARQPGWLIGEVDQSGAEFRAAGFLTQDPQIALDIREDADIHRFTASVITKKAEKDVSKVERDDNKEHTFKPLYGGQSGTEDEQRYYKAFQKKYHVAYETQTKWTHDVLVQGKLVMPWGLVFSWPDTRERNGYITNTPTIFNYPVSSLATAEMAPVAVVYLWHRIRANAPGKIILVNTIHDSGVAEVHPDVVELFTKLGIQCFTLDVYHYLSRVYNIVFNYPLGAGITVGTHWKSGILKEVEINVEQDGEYWAKGSRRSH